MKSGWAASGPRTRECCARITATARVFHMRGGNMPARPAKYAALRLKELEEQRRRVVAAMRDLVENSEREGRSDLTAEEAAAFNAMDAAQEKLRKQIEQYKDYEDLLRQHKDFSHEQLLAMYVFGADAKAGLYRSAGWFTRVYCAPALGAHRR
jgi:hypothetical protein